MVQLNLIFSSSDSDRKTWSIISFSRLRSVMIAWLAAAAAGVAVLEDMLAVRQLQQQVICE
jgi:hypothetical protein